MDVKPILIKDKFGAGIKNRSLLLKNGVKRLGILGGSGSGKTTFITKWYIPMIHEAIGGITVVAKNTEQHQYEAVEKYCKKAKINYNLLEEFSMDNMSDLRHDDLPKLIIYDDLANTDNMDALLAVAKYGRVKHIYLAVIAQDYKSIPIQVRQNLNQYLIFPLGAPHAARSMINGLSAFVNEENLKRAYKFICKPENKYSCIFIQLDGMSVVISKNGDLWDLSNFQSIYLKSKKDDDKDDEEDV